MVTIPVKVETPAVKSVILPTSAWRVVKIPELMVAIPLTTKFSVTTEFSSICDPPPPPPSTLMLDTSKVPMVATPILASVIEAKPMVAIPLIFKFLPFTSSYEISPRTLRLPATNTSLAKVATPTKVERPVTFSSAVSVLVAVSVVTIPVAIFAWLILAIPVTSRSVVPKLSTF